VDLDYEGSVPLYQQLASLLREQIRTGEIGPDRPIPSKTSLKQEYGISDTTVNAALAILRAENLIRGVKGKGIFVVPEDERPA
jgi:DNA-binding GntR family transcriptional regulator